MDLFSLIDSLQVPLITIWPKVKYPTLIFLQVHGRRHVHISQLELNSHLLMKWPKQPKKIRLTLGESFLTKPLIILLGKSMIMMLIDMPVF